jgi:CheY-like chemotaxis protein
LSVQVSGSTLTLRLADNGSGIPAEILPRIFDLFAQSDRALARAQGGLGIGLTVVRRLVEMHGGTVSAASAGVNQGSEFAVTLPLLDAAQGAGFDGTAQPAVCGQRYKIAVIEDNVDANDVLRMLLQMMGHEVFSAFDGVSGVALIRSNRPQVVLCDIGLPGLDGYAVMAKLRAEMTPPLPCMIALTGYGQAEDRMRALAAGFDHHLVKPVDPETLMQRIAEHFKTKPIPGGADRGPLAP